MLNANPRWMQPPKTLDDPGRICHKRRMKWIEAKVIYQGRDMALGTELIANAFDELGIQGVVMEDPDLAPAEGWGADSLGPPLHHSVAGYMVDNESRPGRCQRLEAALAKLAEPLALHYQIRYRGLDEEDWAESWKAYFWPERITEKIVVKPTWRTYTAQPQEVVIEIDPGMAFGTGTHPTTAMCLELIETHLTPGGWLLDVGTGSGILMVAAVRLGARFVAGVDNDAAAVVIARRNLLQNRIEPTTFGLCVTHLVSSLAGHFDVVVANILSEVILALLDDVLRVMRPGSLLICSGIIAKNCPAVLNKLKRCGFEVVARLSRQEWVAIAAVHGD
jgi:ribosomal protein L11 methyltransferase